MSELFNGAFEKYVLYEKYITKLANRPIYQQLFTNILYTNNY